MRPCGSIRSPRHRVIITDTGSYSDIVFGLLHLLGRQYRPRPRCRRGEQRYSHWR
ncbi:Tn3 family transposase [Nocardia sp. NPDC004278]